MAENPPVVKKKEYLSQKEKKSEYDISPEELSEKKKEFFDYIDSVEENRGRDELVKMVSTIAEHSVEDAINLINKNKFTQREVSDVFNGQKSFLKNNSFTQSLRGELKDRLYDAEHTFEGVYNQNTDYAGGMYIAMKSMGTGDENLEKTFSGSERNAHVRIALQPQETKFEEIAKDYYSYYLANRNFNFEEKSKDSTQKAKVSPEVHKPSPRMKPEQEAKKHLKDLLLYMEKQYLASEVSNILVRELKRNDPEAWQDAARSLFESDTEDGLAIKEVYGDDFEEYFKALKKGTHNQDARILNEYYKNNNIFSIAPKGPFISEHIVKEQILKNFPLEIGKKIEDARYKKLDIVYNADKGVVEKDLVRELNEKIKKEKGKAYEVGLNREKNVYEVVDTLKDQRQITEKDIELYGDFANLLSNKIDELYRDGYKFDGTWFTKFDSVSGDPVKQKSADSIWKEIELPKHVEDYFNSRDDVLPQEELWGLIEKVRFPKELKADYFKDNIDNLIEWEGKEWAEKRYQELKELGAIPDSMHQRYIEGRIVNFDPKKQEGKESGSKEVSRVEEVPSQYTEFFNLTNIDGKLTYQAQKDGKWIIVSGDKEYGAEYDVAYSPTEVAGKLTYQARKDRKWIIVSGDKEYGAEYDVAHSPTEVAGKLTYQARKDGKLIIVSVNFSREETEFDEDLDLLNLVHNPDKEKIEELLKEELVKEEEEENSDDFARKSLRNSKAFLQGLAKTIKESPRDFIQTIAAKKTSAERMLAKQVVEKLLPGIYDLKDRARNNYERSSESLRDFFGGNSSSSESITPKPGDYFYSQENLGYQGGNPSEKAGKSEVVIESREDLRGYISSGLFGKENNGNWTKVSAPLDMSIDGPTRENTFTMQLGGRGGRINLQKPVPAEIIPGRVQGRNESGQMVEIPYSTNILGESVADVPAGISELVYSFSEPLLDETPRNIDSTSLEVFKNKLSREGGEDYLGQVPGLDEEIEVFVDSIEGLTPKEKIFAIEKYVREIGYYDFENGEVSGMKRGATTDEMFYVMKTRLESLRDEKGLPEGKRFAGVCDDFSKITTAILRKAGLPAGVMTCFRPNVGSKQATVGDAHAASFVVWPSSEGKNKIYIVDGTPGGTTPEEQQMLEEMGIAQPTLEEKEKGSEEEKNELIQKAEQELQEISEYLETLTPERIGEIDNGKLEKALNTVLRYDVSYENLNAVTRILSAYRFSPLGKFDLGDLGDKIEAHKFIETELRLAREQKNGGETQKEHHPGTKLFSTVKEFSAKEGLQKLQELNSVTKGILKDKEERALSIIVKYLEAKRMV